MVSNKDLIIRAKAVADWALTVDELKRLVDEFDIKGDEPDEANG